MDKLWGAGVWLMSENQNKLYKDVALEVTIDAKRGAKNQEIKTHATFYSYDVQSGLIKINIKKDGAPMPLPNGTQVLISAVKLDLPQQKMVFTGDIVDNNNGIAHWIIPDKLQGYKGDIRAGVFIKLPNNQRLHGGYFRFHMGISEIDENLFPFEKNYWQGWHDFQKEAEQEWNAWKASRDKTWREHEEAYYEWKKQQENKQTNYENDTDERWNNWRNQQEKSQSDFESNFAFWKSEQEEKQTGFESDFADWKNTQETKQTTFGNGFADWKNTQETKQTNFESDTNETINGINTKVGETQTKISDLEKNLDVEQKNYFSIEAWKERASTAVITNDFPATKIRLEANTKYTLSTNIPKSGDNKDVFFAAGDVYEVNTSSHGVAIDEPRTITTNVDGAAIVAIRDKDMTSGDWWIMLNKGETSAGWVPNADDLATKPDLSDYAKKQDVNTLKESLPKFENEELIMSDDFENAFPDKKSTRLQYVLQGKMMQIFGLIRTKKELKGKSTYIVGGIPDKFNLITEGYNYGTMGARYHFKTLINDKNDSTYPNKVTIRRITDVDNQYVDISADEKGIFHISLTIGVELNG